jgi:hypothetical protein
LGSNFNLNSSNNPTTEPLLYYDMWDLFVNDSRFFPLPSVLPPRVSGRNAGSPSPVAPLPLTSRRSGVGRRLRDGVPERPSRTARRRPPWSSAAARDDVRSRRPRGSRETALVPGRASRRSWPSASGGALPCWICSSSIQVGGHVSCGHMLRRRVAKLDGRGRAHGGANRRRRPPNRALVGHIGVRLRGSRSTVAESSSDRAHRRLAALDLTTGVAGGAL